MKGNRTILGLIILAIGLVIVFAGSKLTNIGDQVDSLVGNTWTGVLLSLIGAGLLLFGSGALSLKARSL